MMVPVPVVSVDTKKSRVPDRRGDIRTSFAEAFARLVTHGFLQSEELKLAIADSLRNGVELENILIDKFRIPKEVLGRLLSEYFDCPYQGYDSRILIDADLLKNLSLDYLRKNRWIPVQRRENVVEVLTDDPHNVEKRLDVRRAFPAMTICYTVGLRRDIDQFLSVVSGDHSGDVITDILGELVSESQWEEQQNANVASINENDSAIVRLANQVIAEAYRLGASDIHIEPYADRKDTMVRFRVDGSCFTYMKIPAAYRRAVVSRVKIMANLDIAERRKPQDGKIRFKLTMGKEIELRVATLPTAGLNEDVVIRLLSTNGPRSLHGMEFHPSTRALIDTLAQRPHGIFLCAGPTGSGKTTTLHAILASINTDERKIWTAEDPIEITQEGLRQVQVHPKIGLTFAAAMRAFLRADPDVIMIGEMRDKETADIAIEASLTGHLVFSTIHTNSAVETVTRLLDLGCDPFNFSDAMLGVLAMRLCKRICQDCKEAYEPTDEEYKELMVGYGSADWPKLIEEHNASFRLYRGRGCGSCAHTGFKGRVPLHELMAGSEAIQDLIQGRARTTELLQAARREGMTTLIQDGIRKVLQGLTTYKQVRAVVVK
jgi:type II secretory ATPase GspE/PulE/Tfp pilus assembly ATPase PilB-like protein